MGAKRGWLSRTLAARPAFHEQYVPEEAVVGPSNRAFGFTVGGALALIGLTGSLMRRPSGVWLIAGGVGLLAVALVAPGLLAPLNKLWLKFGLLLHRVITPVALGFLFYLVFAPMGLLLRVLGRRPLRLGREPHLSSYWVERASPAPPDSMRRQF